MFKFFEKDPIKKLDKEYARLLREATALQRSGDIKGFALKTAEANAINEKISALEKQAAAK